MSGCGPDCACSNQRSGVVVVDQKERAPIMVSAKQPDGWHACLKQKTRCVIKVPVKDFDTGQINIRTFEATNSCHVEDAEECPRVTAGAASGEGYDLCGPPNHAEQEAAKFASQYFPYGVPVGSVAYLYGHTYLCMDCQHALTLLGVNTFVVTGEPA